MKSVYAFLIVMLCAIPDSMAQSGGNLYYLNGDDIYVATVDTRINNCYREQVRENWCWAACAQMVLLYNGLNLLQSDIAKRVYGGNYDVTANAIDIVNRLDGWYVSYTRIRALRALHKDAEDIVKALLAGVPLIVGINDRQYGTGHAVVLSRILFRRNSSGSIEPYRVVVLDPGRPYSKEITYKWEEFYSMINTLIYISTE